MQKFQPNRPMQPIHSPDDDALEQLCDLLREMSNDLISGVSQNGEPVWPAEQLKLISQYGVGHWFVPTEQGGFGWSQPDIVAGYLKLSAACLTTTFILTQRVAATKRIVISENEALRARLIPEILSGQSAATVGISHLTTSRRHVGRPVLTAEETATGFLLNGFSPWVTGGYGADYLVMGAEMDDGRQVLLSVPATTSGVTVKPGFALVGLSASQTGPVHCDQVNVDRKWLMAGPIENVLTAGSVSATGGFQTSALATGLATAAVDFIGIECEKRPELSVSYESLKNQLETATKNLIELASGVPVCSSEVLRTEANSLVLRATQAALVAAKGTGYVESHRVGRWCREALFFLVWSCPQSVANANLCELAGIEDF